jgi:hypothetical protein
MNRRCVCSLFRLGLLGAGLLVSGCVARREAILANEALKTNSVAAAQAVGQLQAIAKKEVAAHLATRRQLQAALTNAAAAHQAATLHAMNAELQQALLEIQTTHNGLLIRLATLRREKAAELEVVIEAALRPLQAKADELKAKAQRAFADFKAAPNETVFRERHIAADKDYLAVQGIIVDLRLDAWRAGLDEIGLQEAAARERLAAACAKQVAAATEIYRSNASTQPGGGTWLPDLGPDPLVPEAGFVALQDYTVNVGRAADGNLNYLRSNSLGMGSFFRDFLSAAGRGAASAIIHPAARSVDSTALLQDAAAWGKDLLGDFKTEVGGAVSGFQSEGASVLADVARAMTEKARAAAETFVKEKIVRFEDRRSENAATSNPSQP